jgi:hypothetical protein
MKPQTKLPQWLRAPRISLWISLAIVLLVWIALTNPVQIPVVGYKTALIALAAVLGFLIDRTFFPYARPDSYLLRDWTFGSADIENGVDYPVAPDHQWAFCAAMLRRAIVVGAVVLGFTLGL